MRLLSGAHWATRVIDLSLSKADLWRGVRKSYRSLIHKAERELTVEAIPQRGAGGLIRTCQRVHRFDAGRQTRPDATWDLMGDWADDGSGLIAMAFDYTNRPVEMLERNGEPGNDPFQWLWLPCVDYAYFVVRGAWAYYASAASLRAGAHHAVIWHALLELKVRGVRWVEMGWQRQAVDEKGNGVEMFRRGFGGQDEPAQCCSY